jgi:hypothetical protein
VWPDRCALFAESGRSVKLKPAVHVDNLSGDGARERRRREEDGMGDLLRLAEPADRDLRDLLFSLLIRELLGHHWHIT